jgi:ABC-2 type transport system permease protein
MIKSISRILALSKKEFIHLRRDWWLPAFMLIGGAMELLVIGWATSRPITNLPLLVWDQSRSVYSRELVAAVENAETFTLKDYVDDMQTIRDQMDRGQINAALIIPVDFDQQMSSPSGSPTLQVLLNGAESMPATAALRTFEGLTREMGMRITLERLGMDEGELAGFDPSLRVWFNEKLSEALYTTPAEMALMMEFTILLFAALTFSRERELGTLENLLVMPFSSLEIIIGKSIPVILVGFVDFLLMLLIVNMAFKVPVRGSLPLLLGLAFIYILVELSKGLVISVFSKTQHQAFLIVMIVGFIDFMFTGYAAPVESMPAVLQQIANIVPAHHWLAIMRGIMLKGADLGVLWPNVLALVILGLVIGFFSILYVRRALQ